MSLFQLVLIVALVGFAIYKQTQTSEVTASGGYRMALIYGLVGVAVGVWNSSTGALAVPSGVLGWSLAGFGVLLSVVIGAARGIRTRLWVDESGRVMSRGSVLTVSLFVALLVTKIGVGVIAYINHVAAGSSFPQVMVLVAIMIAFQAAIVGRRADALRASSALAARAALPIA